MRNSKKGFTIVELVIVIAVIAILAAVLIPTFSGIIDNANKSAAEQEARNAYTNYLAEHVSDAKFESKVCVETSKGYYVYLDNGSVVNNDTVKTTNTKPASFALGAKVATDYVCFKVSGSELVGSGN